MLPESSEEGTPRVVHDNQGDPPEPPEDWEEGHFQQAALNTQLQTRWPERQLTVYQPEDPRVLAVQALERRSYLQVAIEGGVVPASTNRRVGNSNTNQSYRIVAGCSEADKADYWRPQIDYNNTLNVVSQDDPRWAHVYREVTALRMRPEVLSFVGINRLPRTKAQIQDWVKTLNAKHGTIFFDVHCTTEKHGYKYVYSSDTWVPGKTAWCANTGGNRTCLVDDNRDTVKEFRCSGGMGILVSATVDVFDAFDQIFSAYRQGHHVRGSISAPDVCPNTGRFVLPDGHCFECGLPGHVARNCPQRIQIKGQGKGKGAAARAQSSPAKSGKW